MMARMSRDFTFHRPSAGAGSPERRALRTREPRGIIEPAEATALLSGLVGHVLTAVDTSMERLVLAIATDPVHLVVIAGPTTLVAADTSIHLLDEPSSPEALSALGGWLERPLTQVAVEPSGTLRLECGGERLVVAADPQHESWEVRGMDGALYACLPGGAISAWGPTSGRIPVGG